MKSHGAWERTYLAVDYLASSEGNLNDRLEMVYKSHLIPLRTIDFRSVRAKELFNRIMDTILSAKQRAVPLSDEEAKKTAKDIVSLFNQITYFEDED